MPDRRLVAARRLFVGAGVVPGRGVLVNGASIERVVTEGQPLQLDSQVVVDDFATATVLPGLIDAHSHLCLAHGEDLHQAVDSELVQRSYEWGRRVARQLVRAGVTTARDLGCRADSAQRLRDSLGVHDLDLVVSGQPITTPSGHFSSFGLNVRGIDAARRAVERLADEGADLVKVMATGGMLTPGTEPGRAQFTFQELQAVVARAHALGLRVAAHAHGIAGVALSVAVEVDTIEHCSWLNDDGSPGMPDIELVGRIVDAEQTIVIAAPLPAGSIEADGDGSKDTHGSDSQLEPLRRSWRNMMLLRREGVRVALGTDSIFGQFPDHKDLQYRAEAMVRYGNWKPVDVIDLMTEGGAAALGRAGQIGRLTTGARSDLVVVDGDPATDITALRRVRAVYREGTRIV